MSPERIAACRTALRSGAVAIVPTDTVYGAAAALDQPDAVAALYALKGRPRSQPCQVLVFGERTLAATLDALPDALLPVLRALLPGTTTCIVPDPSGRFAAASGDAPGSVGLRAPKMPPDYDAIDLPLIATSANHPGGPDPRAVGDVPADVRAGAGYVLDAGTLPGVASAVVDLRDAAVARVIRPGPDPAALAATLRRLGREVADERR